MCQDKALYWKRELAYSRDWPRNARTRCWRRFARRQAHKAERAQVRLSLKYTDD